MNRTQLIVAGVGIGVASFAGGYFTGDLIAKRHAESYINDEITRGLAESSPDKEITVEDDPEEKVEAKVEIVEPSNPEHQLQKYLSAYKPDEVTVVEEINHEVDPDDPDDFEEHARIVKVIDETGEDREVYQVSEDMINPEVSEELRQYRIDRDEDESIPAREKWRVTVISEDEFRTGMAGQSREELTYYESDDTVADSDGVEIDDVTVFGDGLSQFGMFGVPNDTVYIRNLELHTDMHITKVKGSYSELVLRVPLQEDNDDRPGKMRAYNE